MIKPKAINIYAKRCYQQYKAYPISWWWPKSGWQNKLCDGFDWKYENQDNIPPDELKDLVEKEFNFNRKRELIYRQYRNNKTEQRSMKIEKISHLNDYIRGNESPVNGDNLMKYFA